jgi:hypothetical protein
MRQDEDVIRQKVAAMALGAALTEEQARAIFRLGEEAVVFALLQQAQLVGAQAVKDDLPSRPSGMTPTYEKPTVKSRRKRPGRKPGHPGSRRPTPARIDARQEHRLPNCPHCRGRLKRCRRTRTRIIEDIPTGIEPVVTEHTIHRDWCPHCRAHVEPPVPDALPGSTLGLRVLVLSAWLHYGLGTTLSQIVEVFNFHLQLKLTPGALMQQWYRLQAILYAWYEQIQIAALEAAVLHADETGWRVAGKTAWLWCFASNDAVYFMVDRARGSPALQKFFIQEFAGTLVSDFWGAYNKVACARRQMCLAHLLRDFITVEKYKRPSDEWPTFAKKIRRLLRDAIRLSRRDDLTPATYDSRRARLDARLQALLAVPWRDTQAKRLIKRLRRHQNHLFTFLDEPDVPFDNNHAERTIRPAVIIRKNSYCNRSQRGADTQAVMMSIYRTLKLRGHDPIRTVIQSLTHYLTTGNLPPLPPKNTANG